MKIWKDKRKEGGKGSGNKYRIFDRSDLLRNRMDVYILQMKWTVLVLYEKKLNSIYNAIVQFSNTNATNVQDISEQLNMLCK